MLNKLKSILSVPSNAELNPICHLLALLGAHHICHVSGLRVKQTIRNVTKSRYSHQHTKSGLPVVFIKIQKIIYTNFCLIQILVSRKHLGAVSFMD